MKQLVAVSLIAFYLCVFGSSNKSFEDEISNSQCGFNVHSLKRSHEEMIKTGYMGKNAEECCASPKFCPALKSTACTRSSAAVSAMTGAHVPLPGIRVGPAHPLLAIASKSAPGKSRSPATAGSAEAQASQTPDGRG